ncbi:hypothetical protein JTB14_016231 [Gonioctena quinquepunctata]|nr:hypothetical protein JTB14_016231 [Gonioctena quinquepunctata]
MDQQRETSSLRGHHKGYSRKALTFILIFLVINWCQGIIVFDCSDPKTDIVSVSLRDVAKCPEPASEYASAEKTIKVIQKNEINTIQEIGGIIMNGTTTTAITIDGSCEGTIYHEGGRTWEDAIITATVKIQAKDYQSRVKMEENQISLFGGVMCPFLPGYCFDTTLGESVWKSNTPIPCEERGFFFQNGTNMINQELYVVVESGENWKNYEIVAG